MRHPIPGPTRRRLLQLGAAAAAAPVLAAMPGCAAPRGSAAGAPDFRLRPGGHSSGFDPWLEILGDAFRHNARETARLGGGTPILAVIKNNAYGLGDQVVGPIVAACPEVMGLACVRVGEALALRSSGVGKPILDMAETSADEIVELAQHGIWPSVWLDDARARLEQAAARLGRPVAMHCCLDCGMGREGMPDRRAGPWLESLAQSAAVEVAGTYMMFTHDLDFDREQLARFVAFTDRARAAGLPLGRLHASPSLEVLYLPEARFDLVRPGNLLFGNWHRRPGLAREPDLRPVFRLCARVARVELLQRGESASFERAYVAKAPTWLALLPVGHTDGYPAAASGKCRVLVNGRLFPVVAEVSSTHTILDLGRERAVEPGDVATLIGPDDPAILPHAVAGACGLSFYQMITKFSALLPKRVV
jgi:alanine racemase